MIKKLLLWAAIFSFLFVSFPKTVLAIEAPNFPSCNNPHEFVRAHYDSGKHGIVGSSSIYTGSDTVYDLGNDNHYQCFCSDSGQGIQTNWWKVSSLTDAQIQLLKNQGWYHIPDGSAWGLASGDYMAINNNYSCGGIGGGDVLGASTGFQGVLGLAYTGKSTQVASLLGAGIILAVIAFSLKRKQA